MAINYGTKVWGILLHGHMRYWRRKPSRRMIDSARRVYAKRYG